MNTIYTGFPDLSAFDEAVAKGWRINPRPMGTLYYANYVDKATGIFDAVTFVAHLADQSVYRPGMLLLIDREDTWLDKLKLGDPAAYWEWAKLPTLIKMLRPDIDAASHDVGSAATQFAAIMNGVAYVCTWASATAEAKVFGEALWSNAVDTLSHQDYCSPRFYADYPGVSPAIVERNKASVRLCLRLRKPCIPTISLWPKGDCVQGPLAKKAFLATQLNSAKGCDGVNLWLDGGTVAEKAGLLPAGTTAAQVREMCSWLPKVTQTDGKRGVLQVT